jgi:glycosyltransferase involved in cell wall biosynthesis
VSVIIPCFNHGEFLQEAVASVIHVGREDVELIVVDDGSTDQRTSREMDALAARGIKVIRQENKGLPAARNAGIIASKGEYILPLDADNHVRSGYFEYGIRILDANPKVGVVYGDAEYFGTRTGRWQVGAFDRDRLLQWNYIDACAIYRRSVWEQNGGYDATLPVWVIEDWDFWLTTLERGWQFAYVPEVLFDYRVAVESMATRARAFEPQIEELLAAKHGLLYRRVCLEVVNQQKSVRWSFRHLCRLLKARFKPNKDREPFVNSSGIRATVTGIRPMEQRPAPPAAI